jgi:lysophospholipase L1-like esterase
MPANSFHLRDGERVVFYGDSITEHRHYTMFAETYVLTRFPKLRMRFYNAGWGGDKVSGGPNRPIDVRLRRDVVAHLPTVVTIMLGMNDAGWRAFDQELFSTYTKGYEHIVDTLQSSLPNVRITAIRPSPFDDVTQEPRFPGGYNEVIQYYGAWIDFLAKHRKLDVADLNTPVVQALQRAQEINAERAPKIMGDRAHPSPAGHLLMTMALLNAWKAPAMVSAVEIDATRLRTARATNTRVTQLRWTPFSSSDNPSTAQRPQNPDSATLSWMQLDNALPFPIDHSDSLMKLHVMLPASTRSSIANALKVSGVR